MSSIKWHTAKSDQEMMNIRGCRVYYAGEIEINDQRIVVGKTLLSCRQWFLWLSVFRVRVICARRRRWFACWRRHLNWSGRDLGRGHHPSSRIRISIAKYLKNDNENLTTNCRWCLDNGFLISATNAIQKSGRRDLLELETCKSYMKQLIFSYWLFLSKWETA